MIADFIFSIPTQIQFGSGVSRQAGAVTRNLIAARSDPAKAGVLVVLDPGIKEAAWLGDILASIQENDLQIRLFDKVRPNPRDEDVHQAAALLKQEKCSAVVAIGGGSTLDTAKVAALLATFGGQVNDYAGWAKVPGPTLPLVVIPTTAGSGSEATCWAVITDSLSHNKLAIGDRNLSPAVALVDPNLTISLPPNLTAATGMDALTHAIEAYVCALSSPVNDLLALEAIRLVAIHLRRVITRGDDLEARQGMMLASTLGGIAINNADVAGVHCLSEGMGSLYDAPHGLLNASSFAPLHGFLAGKLPGTVCMYRRTFWSATQPGEAVSQVAALTRWLKFPSLAEIGVKAQDLPKLAALAAANVSNPSNPTPMTDADYLGILEMAMTGQI